MRNESQSAQIASLSKTHSTNSTSRAPSSVSKTYSPETLELADLLAPFSPHVPLADIQRLVGYLESDRTVEVFRQLDGRFNLEKFSKLWRGPVPEDVAEQARAEGFPMPDAFM